MAFSVETVDRIPLEDEKLYTAINIIQIHLYSQEVPEIGPESCNHIVKKKCNLSCND